jgi:hypothetical protein
MKRWVLFPILALVTGFTSALLAAVVHSMFLCLLPVLAFTFGYFSSWVGGLINGFLLFLSYTFTIALMWENTFYPGQYLIAFMFGGFSLLIMGALAPLVRYRIKKLKAIAIIIILVIAVCSYGYISMPRYHYGYTISLLRSPQNLVLYLPLSTAEEPYAIELLENSQIVSRLINIKDFSQGIVKTEYGQMLRVNISDRIIDLEGIIASDRFGYEGKSLSCQRYSTLQKIKFTPRLGEITLNIVKRHRFIGPLKVGESIIVGEFRVPVKIESDTEDTVSFSLTCGISRRETINFGYTRSESYNERIEFDGSPGDDWQIVPVTATSSISVIGIMD